VATQGGIGTVAVDEWVGGGSITTLWIKNLLVTGDRSDPNNVLDGDFSPDLFLTGLVGDFPIDVQKGLTLAGIKGTITGGTWNLAASVGSIAAGATASSWVFAGSPLVGAQGTFVNKIGVRDTLAGSISAISFSVIRAGELAADITSTFASASSFSFGIGLLSAGVVRDTDPALRHSAGDVDVRVVSSKIGRIVVGEWEDGQIETFSILQVTTTGLRTTLAGPPHRCAWQYGRCRDRHAGRWRCLDYCCRRLDRRAA
jgi:hypothetical protein